MDPILPEGGGQTVVVGWTTLSCRNFGNSLPWKVCFLLLEPHCCCQIGLCKLHPILATHTSHLPAQIHGAAL